LESEALNSGHKTEKKIFHISGDMYKNSLTLKTLFVLIYDEKKTT